MGVLTYLEKSVNNGKGGGQGAQEKVERGELTRDAGKEGSSADNNEILRAKISLVSVFLSFVIKLSIIYECCLIFVFHI